MAAAYTQKATGLKEIKNWWRRRLLQLRLVFPIHMICYIHIQLNQCM